MGIPEREKKGICRKDVKNRGNELKHLFKTKELIITERKNELETNWLLRAKISKWSPKETNNGERRETGNGPMRRGRLARTTILMLKSWERTKGLVENKGR